MKDKLKLTAYSLAVLFYYLWMWEYLQFATDTFIYSKFILNMILIPIGITSLLWFTVEIRKKWLLGVLIWLPMIIFGLLQGESWQPYLILLVVVVACLGFLLLLTFNKERRKMKNL